MSIKMNILAVDPGLSGACAVFKEDRLISIIDMPTVSVVRNGKSKKDIDYSALRFIREIDPGIAVVEKVSSMKSQGVSSVFAFGKSTGALLGAAGALGWYITEVTPQAWKKEFSLIGKSKDHSRLLALELFPGQEHFFKRKKDNGRSDAALIGLYLINHGKSQRD